MDRLRIMAETAGFFTRTDALEAGYDDKAIRRALRARLWTRLRPGAYTFTDLWVARDEIDRHRARARAVMSRLGDRVALSHTSAAVEQDLTLWNADLSRVHVTRLDGGAGRTEAGVVHHEGFCLDDDLEEHDGFLVVKPARAALEAGSLLTTEGAVALFDAGLHRERFEVEELNATLALMQSWPGAQHLRIAVRFADGRAESVGESRSRYLCYVHGLPAPDLQFEVYDAQGNLLGISDLAWHEHRLLGEFDGKIKYGRLLKADQEPGDVVFSEKVREDLLRETTRYGMVRLIWADLYRGAQTAARIRRLMRAVA
jgi:hypothetical protein